MSAEGGTAGPEGEREGTAPGPAAEGGPPAAADRVLLWVFSAYVALLLVAAVAQVTGNRFLLDLFDLRRLFTG